MSPPTVRGTLSPTGVVKFFLTMIFIKNWQKNCQNFDKCHFFVKICQKFANAKNPRFFCRIFGKLIFAFFAKNGWSCPFHQRSYLPLRFFSNEERSINHIWYTHMQGAWLPGCIVVWLESALTTANTFSMMWWMKHLYRYTVVGT